MRTSRFYAFGLVIVILGLSYFSYLQFIAGFGFWDGYASELDRAERALARDFIAISGLTALWFIFVGVASVRNMRMKLFYGVGFYVVVVMTSLAIDLYFRSHLTDGAGG